MKKLSKRIQLTILFVIIATFSNAQGTCDVASSPLVISKSTILETGNYYQDIILKDGAIVSVTDATLNFGINRKIFIGKGSTLKLQNATLTSACEEKWHGIVVESSESKADDGKVEIIFSTINNAVTGVN